MANEGKKQIPPTRVYFDPAFLEHDPGEGHPESADRLRRIVGVLDRAPLSGVERVAARPATREELARVHEDALLDTVASFEGRRASLDADTSMSPGSHRAALLAAGSAVAAVEAVWSGQARNAFCLVRPPGHHAEPNRAMGFCLYNNAAIAAEAARVLGAQRVAVLDWDVHHGNGTQAAFYARRDVLYLSSHQFPFYPGTGAPTETGVGEGAGFTVNCALPAGQTDADFGAVFHDVFMPVCLEYRPDLLIVSAGFDPHAKDPLGGMRATERGFAAMTSAVAQLAEQVCGGKLVLLLEGGYHLDALAQSVHACLEVLTGSRSDFPGGTGRSVVDAIRQTRQTLSPHWSCFYGERRA